MGRSPGRGNGTPLQCSCPENPMDAGGWWAAVHAVRRSWTPLSLHTRRQSAVLLGQLELTQKGFIVYPPTLFEFILCFWATPHLLWDLRFLTKDGTQAPSSESAESSPLDCRGNPLPHSFRGCSIRNIFRPMNKKHINTRTRRMGFPALRDELSPEKTTPRPWSGL